MSPCTPIGDRSAPVPEPTIYVVDDDEAVRDSLSLLLESHGMAVQSYDSAGAFLAGYRSGGLGCLLLDLHMPEMGGIDLLECSPPLGIPVIVISGRVDAASRSRAFAAGARAVLDKPFRDQDLLSAIHTAICGFRA